MIFKDGRYKVSVVDDEARTGAYQDAVVVAASAVVADKVGSLDEAHNSAQPFEGDQEALGQVGEH